MKRYYLLILVCIATVSSSFKPKTREIRWMEWNEGYPLANKKEKLILVDVYTDWCGWCKKMDYSTYADKQIAEEINENFVAIRLNPELMDQSYNIENKKLNGFQLMDLLTNSQREGYPTIIIINAKLDHIISAKAGYQDVKTLKQNLDNALKTRQAEY